jgi:predicted 2-oxoglutarate/Fe(II)-dependent dioxygenase YbiX|tara:strand:- start:1257 stop:1814 length:558 start_codon:yes stop_codon:yes gene_type:complete
MQIKDCIKVYEDVFPLETLSSIIRYLNVIEFNPATIVNNGTDRKIRNTEVYNLSRLNDKMTDVHWAAIIQKILVTLINKYFKDMQSEISCNRIVDISFLKYEEGGFYKWHTDHCAEFPRTVSAIFILNNDYEGGELCFRNPDGSGEITIDKKANSIILWPSNFLYPHTVKPVKKGTRFSIVGWAL